MFDFKTQVGNIISEVISSMISDKIVFIKKDVINLLITSRKKKTKSCGLNFHRTHESTLQRNLYSSWIVQLKNDKNRSHN